MSPIGSTLAKVSLAFMVATAPVFTTQQEMSADFEQVAITQSVEQTQEQKVCDVRCVIDIAEAMNLVVDHYHDRRQKASARRNGKEDKSPFDVNPFMDAERLLERPAFIRYADQQEDRITFEHHGVKFQIDIPELENLDNSLNSFSI